ncbi:NUDIX domain-containing protein [Brevibacillus migulae]|uniref:NUDIX domain-containing protein n=1 Tax=Brevibacillus migulae TaxID=1644114 RepID=UPI00106E808F|nr:NUDIX domain-containing protein [Brevibacillus migulae]
MPMSDYYKKLRKRIGTELIFCPSAAAIIRNELGEILFILDATSHTWGIPAGAIEPGETPAEAVVREVWEETGLRVKAKHLRGVCGGKEFRWTYPDGNQVEYIIFVFECEVQEGKLQAIDGEAADFRYFSSASLPAFQLPYPLELFDPKSTQQTIFQ